MQDLATLYAGLARGGEAVHSAMAPGRAAARSPAPRLRDGGNRADCCRRSRPGTSPTSCKDAPPPANAKGGRIAYKTGTSYGYRDAWAIGYDGRHTIAVWVGRPDGAATPGLCRPHRRRTHPVRRLRPHRREARAACQALQRGAVIATGSRPAAAAEALPRSRRGSRRHRPAYSSSRRAIAFPPDRAELDRQEQDGDPLVLKAEGGALPLTWLVDGAPIQSDPHKREVPWTPAGHGFVKFSVIDAKGRVDRVTVG